MAWNFSDARSPTALTPTSVKKETKLVKLTFADFTTGGTAAVKAVIPANSTITGFSYWKKTAFSGNGVSAATLSIGVTGTATKYVSAFDVNTPAAGTRAFITPTTLIFENYDPANRTDVSLLFTGTATTGNPTAGELYIEIEYVR
jgi:hypothetical protein